MHCNQHIYHTLFKLLYVCYLINMQYLGYRIQVVGLAIEKQR